MPDLSTVIADAVSNLRQFGEPVDAGHWQGYETQGKPDLITTEIINLCLTAPIPELPRDLERQCKPSIPWAEREFLERVGGVPHNPHHSLKAWPWWHEQTEATMYEGIFSHTYSERFWPNDVGEDPVGKLKGLRYRYGDLADVLNLLQRHPHTRQATFPIFFPEDTGATHGGRIPCTLHYHFLMRNNRLNLWYPIRSCDAVRHFRDDVYMAGRLCQWVIEQLRKNGEPWDEVTPGHLFFTAYSFHVHMGDLHLLEAKA
jgi:hypothetical protein